jgi:predicted Zn-ribbon and HTH transcriptional regulator
MGDVADMMLDGTLCEGCGVYLDGEADDIPRRCPSCAREGTGQSKQFDWVKCKKCGRTVKTAGLPQHMSAKHP